jgi:D-glycero-D-manno-heptose 1,7-bisphosphate phosphatase
VFLDRDGVVNRKRPEGCYVARPDDLAVLSGVPEAIRRLNDAGLLVAVVTNQRGISLGLYTAGDVAAIHARLADILAVHGAHIDGFYICPHDRNQCDCRKPKTGLFEQAMRDFPSIHAHTSVMIGDSLSDIEAGRALGMRTIFIEGDLEHRKPGAAKALALAGSSSVDLPTAVHALLDHESPGLPY